MAQGMLTPQRSGGSGNNGHNKVVPGEKEYKTAHKYYQNHDYESAVLWLQKASDLKYPAAMCDLALMYQYGIGTDADLKKAYSLYFSAAGKPGGYSTQKELVRDVLYIYRKSDETDDEVLSFFSRWKIGCYMPVIHFYMDETEIRREHKLLLDFIIHKIKNSSNSEIIVTGYQQNWTGTAESNNHLKNTRVDNVAKYLVSRGINKNRLVLRVSRDHLNDFGLDCARVLNAVTIQIE